MKIRFLIKTKMCDGGRLWKEMARKGKGRTKQEEENGKGGGEGNRKGEGMRKVEEGRGMDGGRMEEWKGKYG